MQSLPTILLRPGEADRVLAGHPWIYHGSILRVIARAEALEDGVVVQVKDHRQRFLGIGLYNSKSKIRVRLLARERTQIDGQFFRERILQALAIRQKDLPGATSFRLVNSESDLLSGLIIDKYEDVLVVQLSSLGMDQRKHLIVEALHQLDGATPAASAQPTVEGGTRVPRAILERSDVASRRFEGLTESNSILTGQLDGPVPVRLNGLTFQTDLTAGHKTGMYLDQQLNYRLVADLLTREAGRAVPNAPLQILDCFTFNGAFALHCAAALRDRDRHLSFQIHAIDQSPDAIAQAQRNATLNGLSHLCTFEAANVFDWLKAHTSTPSHEKLIPRFDFIILDPPSFTRNRASVPDALRGYKEIHLRALKLLRPAGTLVTFCCSHHVDANLFQEVILAAAYDARRLLRRVATYTQSPDHPILPSIPETEYLKGFAFQTIPQI